MKFLIGLFLGVIFFSNSNAQNIQTELMDGIVDKNYESFTILKNDKNLEPNTREGMIMSSDYVTRIITFTEPNFPTSEVKNKVEDAIKHELIAAGYDHKKSGSNMLVLYSIFSRDGELIGDFNDDDNINTEKVNVDKGTLIISIIDRETGETVWSGFNDGAFDKVSSTEENKIIRSVSELLERLRVESDTY